MVASWRVKMTRSARATLPAAGPALLADLLLDGDDQHVAVQQRRNRRLLGRRLDRTANLPAGGRFPRYIDKGSHNLGLFSVDQPRPSADRGGLCRLHQTFDIPDKAAFVPNAGRPWNTAPIPKTSRIGLPFDSWRRRAAAATPQELAQVFQPPFLWRFSGFADGFTSFRGPDGGWHLNLAQSPRVIAYSLGGKNS